MGKINTRRRFARNSNSYSSDHLWVEPGVAEKM